MILLTSNKPDGKIRLNFNGDKVFMKDFHNKRKQKYLNVYYMKIIIIKKNNNHYCFTFNHRKSQGGCVFKSLSWPFSYTY